MREKEAGCLVYARPFHQPFAGEGPVLLRRRVEEEGVSKAINTLGDTISLGDTIVQHISWNGIA